MKNYRSLFRVSFSTFLGATIFSLTPVALAGTISDSQLQNTDSLISEIVTLEPGVLSKNKSTATPPIKLAGIPWETINPVYQRDNVVKTTKKAQKTHTLLDELNRNFTTKEESAAILKTVPVTTKGPRPGGFIVPAGFNAKEYPKQWSFMDFVTGKHRTKKPVSPYSPFALQTTPAADINFRYLDKPGHEQDFFDPLKRIHIGNDVTLAFGGQFWYRHMRATDARLNAAGRNNSFNLTRLRVHTDIWYQDKVRVFAEFLDARMWGEQLSPLGIDRQHTDMLSLFMDVKLGEATAFGKRGKAYVRVGRQELTYGSQRLISSLDWVNTRRTFQGVKTFYHSPKLDLDTFWVRPMTTQPNSFDQWNKKKDFVGVWGTYKPKKGDAFDLYFLSLMDGSGKATGQGGVKGNSVVHTIGSRYIGTYKRLLFELEGMYQFGKNSNQDISAGAVAVGAGYRIPLPFNPTAWLRYDYASGDNNLQEGSSSNTFNHLFPFGNYYMGWLDRVGRKNIHDFNAQFSLHPQRWLTFISQYHRYYLAEKKDFLYNAGGAGTLRDATGQSGSHVGDEIDVRFNVHVDRHQDILVGYSKMWAGQFMKATRPGINPDLFYVQYNFRF
jgi:hypothetical protein